ncbi:unnamed protein product [Dicrocoelium dendriticum]|nr:unnamed protein product [Dicrocoelium dendriticum]
MHHGSHEDAAFSLSCFTISIWPMCGLLREDENDAALKPRSKKRKRDEPTELPELPLADPPSDFGNLQIPDILSLSIVQPDPKFMDSQNSIYQARPEDITLIEDNINLGYANTLTFGDELGPAALDFFQEATLGQDREPEVFTLFTVPDDVTKASVLDTPPTKQARLESTTVGTEVEPTMFAVTVLEQQSAYQPDLVDGIVLNLEQTSEPTIIKALNISEAPTVLPDAGEMMISTEVRQPMDVSSMRVPTSHAAESLVLPDLPAQDSVSLQPTVQPPFAFQLDMEPLVVLSRVDQDVLFRRPRRGQKLCKLAVDAKTRLSMSDIRWNMEHGDETMVALSSRLAEPSSRTQTRYLLSRCVPRLFAVPATLGTALSSTLCELWCRHRRFGEEHLLLVGDDLNDLRSVSPLRNLSHHQNADRPERLTEEADQSVELRRAGQTTSSVIQSSSLFGASSHLLDVTINQPANVTDLDVSIKTPLLVKPTTAEVDAVRTNTTPVPNITDQCLPQIETTTLVPLPEELEEPMRQPCPLEPKTTVPEAASVPEQLYANAGRVWSRLQELLAMSDSNSVNMTQLCPCGISKRDAAIAFAAVLALAKKRLILPTQNEPYGPITIRYF